jgi:hypothetical protein
VGSHGAVMDSFVADFKKKREEKTNDSISRLPVFSFFVCMGVKSRVFFCPFCV